MSKLPNRIRNSPSIALQADHALKIMDKAGHSGSGKNDEPRVPKGQPGGGEWTFESHPETNTLRLTSPDGSVEDRVGGSTSWRHNNPGNLAVRRNGNTHLYGAIGASGDGDDQYLIFKNQEDGEAALAKQLDNKAATGMTLQELMKGYAPARDKNDPVAYAKAIADFAGITPDTKLNSAEGKAAMPKINAAIHRHEGWVEGTIKRSTSDRNK